MFWTTRGIMMRGYASFLPIGAMPVPAKPRKDIYAFKTDELRNATITLTAEQRELITKLSERTKAGGGIVLERSILIRSLLRTLAKLQDQVNWDEIGDENELVDRLVQAFRRK
jgi:hypothetical protein